MAEEDYNCVLAAAVFRAKSTAPPLPVREFILPQRQLFPYDCTDAAELDRLAYNNFQRTFNIPWEKQLKILQKLLSWE